MGKYDDWLDEPINKGKDYKSYLSVGRSWDEVKRILRNAKKY